MQRAKDRIEDEKTDPIPKSTIELCDSSTRVTQSSKKVEDGFMEEIAVTKKKADSYIADKRKYTIKYGFTDIKKIFKDTFGRESKEFLYISVYEEFPSRDDLGNLVINPPNMTGNVEKR
ncbi:unnamed protein product [Bathycoccus prasinos]